MTETFVNDFATTLNGAINSAVTSLSVNDSPPSGLTANFRIRIDDEFMLVTAIGGTGNKDWTVTREAEESARFPAASHSNAAAVSHILTVGSYALSAHGEWTTYVPTWTSGGVTTIGNGILTGRYKLLDAKTGMLHVRFSWGSTTSDTGTGTWVFTLPSGWTAGSTFQMLAGHILDNGTDNKLAVGKITNGATAIAEITPEGGNTVTKSVPMTWATGDQFNLSGIVELA